MMTRAICSAALMLLLAAPSAVASPTAVGKYKDWTVFTEQSGNETLCYAATQATDKAPKSASHGDVWFFVANSRSGNIDAQPSLKVGYELREDLPGRAEIGGARYPLYGIGREAFAMDEDDPRIVSSLRRGVELRVEAVSKRNTRVTYYFSLSGSADAIDKAAATCG